MLNILYHIWAADTKVKMAWCCFFVGSAICIACLYIEPQGEISDSGLWAVGQFLALAGALLGVYAGMEYKNRQIVNYVNRRLDDKEDKQNQNQ